MTKLSNQWLLVIAILMFLIGWYVFTHAFDWALNLFYDPEKMPGTNLL